MANITYIPPKNNKAKNIKIDDVDNNFQSNDVEGALKELSQNGGSGSNIDDNSTSTNKTWSSSKINGQFDTIANYSLVKHTDGLLYIKKQDGTLIGIGVEVGGGADLSTLSMSITGQTLKLLNGSTELSTIIIPTVTVTDEQLASIIQSKIEDGSISSIVLGNNAVATSNIQDKAVTPNKTNFLEENYINLVYRTTWNDLGWGSSDDATNLGYNITCSSYIDINGSSEIYTKSMPVKYGGSASGYTLIVGCYDNNKTFLGKLTCDSIITSTITEGEISYKIWNQKFTLLKNTRYIKVGVNNGHTYSTTNYDKMNGCIVSLLEITDTQKVDDTNLNIADNYYDKLFNALIKDSSISNSKFKELFFPNMTNFFIEKPLNLINPNEVIKGHFFNSATTDDIAIFDSINVTGYIPVEYGKTYYCYNDGAYANVHSKIIVRGYDLNKTYLGVCYGTLDNDLISSVNGVTNFTIDRKDLAYIRFQYRNNSGNTILSEYDDKKFYTYDDYKQLILTNKYKDMFARNLYNGSKSELSLVMNDIAIKQNLRPLYKKRWIQIGDSLTDWGAGAHVTPGGVNEEELMDSAAGGFMKYVRDKEGILYYNFGSAGATWELTKIDGTVNDEKGNPITSEPSSDQYSAVRRVDSLIINKSTFTPDIITILMGTNGKDTGELSDTSNNLYTMCGAMRYCLENLLREFPTTPIGIILPPQRLDGVNEQEIKNEKIRTIANYYSIPVLDIFHEGQIVGATRVPVDGKPVSGNGSLQDGTHFGDVAKENLGRKLCSWLKTL